MAAYILKKDSVGDFYWILRSSDNFKVIAKSSESYESKQGALDSIKWVKVNAEKAVVKDES